MTTTGVYVGKFIPYHRGHQSMIDYAKTMVDELYVIVCHRTEHPFPAWMRMQWIQACNPGLNVRWIDTTELDEWDSKAWAEKTIEWLGFIPDYTFTSEMYGEAWAHYMTSKHVLVDLDRKILPISATMIRDDPYGNWDYITNVAKHIYTKKICLLGAESVGKSTLAATLAKHYNTTWAPEYGRIYGEERGFGPKEWAECDGDVLFRSIVFNQPFIERYAAAGANKITFCDTSLMSTKIFYEAFYQGTDKFNDEVYDLICRKADAEKYDLYILLAPTVPWVDDGTRNMGEQRIKMHSRFLEELVDKGPITFINTPHFPRRTEATIELIDEQLKEWGINVS